MHFTHYMVNTTDDVRHRAAEYSRAAMGEGKIDKSAASEKLWFCGMITWIGKG